MAHTHLEGIQAAEREEALRQLLREAARLPFDLTEGPLIRAHLFHIWPQDHVLLVVVHHIVTDGASQGILSRELAASYMARTSHTPSPLGAEVVQYADFARWQDGLPADACDRDIAYWLERLHGVPGPNLPVDRPGESASYRGATHIRPMPPPLYRDVLGIGERLGATPFMVLTAAFAALLHRWAGNEDIVFGTVASGRRLGTEAPNLDGVVGFLVNTLVMRLDAAPSRSFADLVEQTRHVMREGLTHQLASYDHLIREMGRAAGIGDSRLLSVACTQMLDPASGGQWGDLVAEPVDIDTGTSKFDLSLGIQQRAGAARLLWEYSTDLFDAATIARLAGHFETLLAGAIANPERRISELPLLTEAERHQILVEWNRTALPYPRDARVHELFLAQAERTPNAVAVRFGDSVQTYSDLHRASDHLAARLQAAGVLRGSMVGVCMERCAGMVTGLLAILKAGGAYVALNPDYPTDRLEYMVVDARITVALTQKRTADRLPASVMHRICIDADNPAADRPFVMPAGDALDLAYVSYTSGSTGTPKGVEIPHRGVVRLLCGTDYTDLGPGQTVLHQAPLAFDASTFEIWGALLNGGAVAVYHPGPVDPAALGALISRHGVTAMWLTASLFNSIVATDPAALSGLGHVLTGGERLSVPHVRAAMEALPDLRVTNGYGPTESTTFTTCYAVPAAYRGDSIPIGRPIANTRCYVLDAHRQPLPIGCVGELWIGGDGLARGYLNRPELTAAAFVADPFTEEPEARMYRSGDLVRYLPDGNLDFVARIDDQVKIRGHRIEPGEVEAVLTAHAGVRQAVVVARDDGPVGTYLAAYATPVPGAMPTAAELAAFVRQTLPEYMVPSSFTVLDALPLLPNGKVDRKALPAPDRVAVAAPDTYVAPRTPLEEEIAGLCAGLLGLERVGVQDDFFALGGHSLLAVMLTHRVREATGVEVPLRVVFERRTVAGMAEAGGGATAPSDALQPIPRRADDGPAPLSSGQERLWFLDRLTPGSPVYNTPVAVRLTGSLNEAALQTALSHVVARHAALRTTFELVDGEPRQRVAARHSGSIETVDLTDAADEARDERFRQAAEREVRLPFDLSAGPLYRATLYRLEATEYVILLVFHHAVVDGWSVALILRELSGFYAAATAGRTAQLPEPAVQYADYAAWQRRGLGCGAEAADLEYWSRRLAALEPVSLPTDRSRPAVESYRGAVVRRRLPADQVGALTDLANRHGASLFMALLAGLQTLIHRYTGTSDIVVGAAAAGRSRPELEGLVGFFVNMLAMRTEVVGDLTFADLMARVRDTALDAFEHGETPFDLVVDAVRPERDMGRHPIFQVMLLFQNTEAYPDRLGELAMEPVPIATGTAKLDLTLAATPMPDGSMAAEWEYSTDLFDAATIERLAVHFETLLAGAVANPEERLHELPLLTRQEADQLLDQWNDTGATYPRGLLHQLALEQAERTPGVVAVLSDTGSLTYAALRDQAGALAAHLRAQGVGPGDTVAVLMRRSLDLAVAYLGVLLSGAAYVPVHTECPQERMAHMLQDAACVLAVCDPDLAFRAAPFVPVTDLRGCPPAPADTAWPEVEPETAAYVMFTSGSTGRPKGVAVPHRAVVNYLWWSVDALRIGCGDRVLQSTTPIFDISVWEFWAPLLVGGCVVLAPPGERLDPGSLLGLIERHGVTIIQGTPSLYRMLLDMPGLGRCTALRGALCGGEAVPADLMARLIEITEGRVRPLCVYGPTEATIWATSYAVTGDEPPGPVCLGRPIANAEAHLLDNRRRLVPVGVTGEVYLAGECLALGYSGAMELTAERFMAVSLPGRPPQRMYRTGDLARRSPDGFLHFMGRADHQIKIRGHRIEPGEIECVLADAPCVRQSLVVAHEWADGDVRLVAYVVPRDGATFDEGAARTAAAARLPDYMLPWTYIALDALPLLPSGKVDRKALPAPDRVAVADPDTYVAPRTPLEEEIAGLCAGLLGLERVGVQDDFFALGGHSLLAAMLAHRVRETMGADVPLRIIFERPTVAHIAHAIEEGQAAMHSLPLVPIRPQGSLPPLVLVHGLAGRAFGYRSLFLALGDELPVYALVARSTDGRNPPVDDVVRLAEDYAEVLAAQLPLPECMLIGSSFGGTVAYELACRLARRSVRVPLVVLLDAGFPDGCAAQPLHRRIAYHVGKLVRTPNGDRLRHIRAKLHTLSRRLWIRRLHQIVAPSALDHWERTKIAHRLAYERYRPGPYCGRVALFRADEHPLHIDPDGAMGWRRFARGDLRVIDVPGDHLTMLEEPHVQALSQALVREIRQAAAASAEQEPPGLVQN